MPNYIPGIDAAGGLSPGLSAATVRATLQVLSSSEIAAAFQPIDGDLTSIATLAGTSGLLRKSGVNTWILDTANYLSGNQLITVSGDATGSGSTAISLTLANSGVTAGRIEALRSMQRAPVTGGTNPTTLAGYGITDAVVLGGALGTPISGSLVNCSNYPYAALTGVPSSFTPSSHSHGNIANAGNIGSTANLPLITTTGGMVTTVHLERLQTPFAKATTLGYQMHALR